MAIRSLSSAELEKRALTLYVNASVYSSELTKLAKAFIEKYMLGTPDKTTDMLWNFSLYKNIAEILNVQDFDVCLIAAETDLTACFSNKYANWPKSI